MKKLVLIGAGGHCKVILDIVLRQYEVVGATDADLSRMGSTFYGTMVLGDDSELERLYRSGTGCALVAVGSTGSSVLRQRLFNHAKSIEFEMINAISDYAVLSPSVKIGYGNAVMDGVIVHADTKIGDNNILNSCCLIEHECEVGDHVHIAPGARIAGGVKIGSGSHIGMGACIIQNIVIGKNSIVGAGAVVISDIPDNSICMGVPAKVVKDLSREGSSR